MNLRRTFAIVYRYFLVLKSTPQRYVQVLLWPTLEIVIWGFLTTYLDSIGQADFALVPALLGAAVLWEFVGRIQQGFSTPFLEDIWTRNLLNLFTTPITIGEYATGLGILSICTGLMGMAVVLVLVFFVFGLSLASIGLLLIPFATILFLFGISLGQIGVSLVLRFGPSGEWYVWPIPGIIAPFAAVFYPVAALPHWMQFISWCLPPTYVFEGMRSVLAGNFSLPMLETGFGVSLLYLAFTFFLLRRIYAGAIRNGSIARYGSESY